MRTKYLLIGVTGIIIGMLLSSMMVLAGSLDPASGPTTAGSQMYTLEQIYNRVNDGTAASKITAFTEPGSGPAGTMYTLDQLYALVGERARVPKTGQTATSPINPAPAGSDGDLEKGVAWPSPRFTNNGDGTVTDHLTGLIWLQDANCNGLKDWDTAVSWANGLYDGCGGCGGTNNNCGLSDSSSAGDWRLANVNELLSLIDRSRWGPALPSGHPFANVQSSLYWSSTTLANFTTSAWVVYLYGGFVDGDGKIGTHYVWPVRGGQ